MTDEAPKKKRASRKKKVAPVVDLATVETTVSPQRERAEACLQMCVQFPLDTQEQRERFGGMLVLVRKELDALETQRKTITGPLNEAKRAVDALFKPVKDLYAAMDKTIVTRLREAQAAATAVRDAALEAVGQGSRDDAVLAVAHESVATPGGLTEVDTYEFEVTAKSEIPLDFLTFDESLALAYVRAKKARGEEAVIPGVTIKVVKDYRRKPGQ